MPPVLSRDETAPAISGLCSGSCSLQVILGCVLPFLAVASSIPIMMIRRRLAHQRSTRHLQAKFCTPRIPATPRLPITSVYVARVNYYLPTCDTVVSQVATEDTLAGTSVHGTDDSDDLSISSPSPIPLRPSLPSLPSLSSMLCEFTVYADAIEPEFLTETRRSSTCLLDSVFSSMDVRALSFSDHPPLSTVRATSTTFCASTGSPSHISNTRDARVQHTDKSDHLSGAVQNPTLRYLCELQVVPVDQPKAQDCIVNSVNIGDTYAVPPDPPEEELIEEITTSQILPTTSTWSSLVTSSSTLTSVLAMRLADFPPVPAFPPLSFISGCVIAAQQSVSSLESSLTCSISVPVSLDTLDILDIRIDDALRQRRPNGPYLVEWPSFSNPGELWDEEDDLQFSIHLYKKHVDLSKPVRHTWTAGLTYSNSEKGDLWDDEDDRRFSCVDARMAPETLAWSSILRLKISHDSFAGLPSSKTRSTICSVEQSYEGMDSIDESADQSSTACCSDSENQLDFKEWDSRFAEATTCLDFDFAFVEELEDIQLGSQYEALGSELWSSSSTSSSLDLVGFEDLSIKSTPIYLSESSRSSLMSLASVLDSIICGVDPSRAYGSENLEKLLEVVDMELEPDLSYSSRIISVNYALAREAYAL